MSSLGDRMKQIEEEKEFCAINDQVRNESHILNEEQKPDQEEQTEYRSYEDLTNPN